MIQCTFAFYEGTHLCAAVRAGSSAPRARSATSEGAGGLKHSHELIQHQPVQGGPSRSPGGEPSCAAAGGRQSCCLHISWQSAVLDSLHEHAELR